MKVYLERWWSRGFPRKVLWFIQRGRRGWSEADAWSLFSHLDHIIVDVVGGMADSPYSVPGNLTKEEWGSILHRIADGFQAHIMLDEECPDYGSERERWLQTKFKVGMKLFAKWYGHLWV